MSEPFDDGSEGLPCVLSEDVTAFMIDPALPPWAMGPIVAAMVEIGETRGLAAGSTAAEDWPELRLLPLGEDGGLGIVEYVIAKETVPPQVIVTRILLY
ncbi:hypothetical protein [Streptomyces xanthophaeus]|uniref:hypothetical protein n=1 Tax=Streptomyces xanthophaeus TaxID=67385 RepID=UPI0026482877|nr:hypothetical protein [Streptomyces xanthophaeus]WKD36623.1 hypothetical protein KO717_34935 [Streptomyces xanthophaeus]